MDGEAPEVPWSRAAPERSILSLAWQVSLGLDFPISIMDWRLSEGLPAQTICVHKLQLNMA